VITLEVLAFLISQIIKRTKIHNTSRLALCQENLKIVLGRKPEKYEINEVFMFHTLYHLYLAAYPIIKSYIKVYPETPNNYNELTEYSISKGAICVSGHIGIPEFASSLFRKHGIKIFALVERLEPMISRYFFNISRMKIGINTKESFKDFVFEMREPKGKIFVLLVDRPIPNSKPTQMFGETFYVSDLPFRLSQRFQLEVFGIACYKEGKKFLFRSEKLQSYDSMIEFLERIIKERYTQWNLFFKRDILLNNEKIRENM